MKTQSDRIAEAFKFICGVRLFSDLDEKTLKLLAQAGKFQRGGL